jgi:hypothetical protein
MRVAADLLGSLDGPTDELDDDAWLEEIERGPIAFGGAGHKPGLGRPCVTRCSPSFGSELGRFDRAGSERRATGLRTQLPICKTIRFPTLTSLNGNAHTTARRPADIGRPTRRAALR